MRYITPEQVTTTMTRYHRKAQSRVAVEVSIHWPLTVAFWVTSFFYPVL